jgi:hypothetical protein
MSRIRGLRVMTDKSCWALSLKLLLLWFLLHLCASEDLPLSSGDTDEGYQWEIQTDEGWVPYWDSQV